MRDTKVLETFLKNNYKKIKEMSLFRLLKKEVNSGANGTQDYIIKKGIGEHPQHIDEVDKLIEKIANAEEKLIVLQQFKL